jgi:Dolichyl-phosphate-mannose-protein mannosyltransferase
MLTNMKNLARLLGLTALAMLVQGYHPGLEDDAYYLAAIKHNLNPALFPHDADFFQVLFQATIFDKLIAFFLRFTHIPLAWGIFFWQCAAILLVLWGCWRIARRCFDETYEQWAAVALVAALLTLPVSGSGLSLTDQHLHPRALATVLILAAIVAVLDGRRVLAGVLLLAAFPLHLNMTPFGISYCVFLMWQPKKAEPQTQHPPTAALALLLIPLGWLFEPSSDAWRQAEATRDFYFLSRWHWYEWLGVVGPLALLWWFRALALSRRSLPKSTVMARVAERMVYFGVFQFAVALILMLPVRLERLRSLEPMRFLHLVYVMLVLLSGGLLARYLLKRSVLRWLLLFVPLCAGMFYAQRQLYPGTVHLELPGRPSGNDWVEAFRWISHNTPVDSQFALDPRYMEMPGEDYHGFRALAERSVLADALKDPCIVVRVPSLGPRWLREMNAQNGWRDFQKPDFLRLKSQLGVDWVVLTNPPVAGMTCSYSNQRVAVCRVE